MTPASKQDDGRALNPAGDANELYESAMQMSELMRANSEAFLQAWTTAMRGMLNYQEHLTRFVGMRMQKDLDMARALSGCRDFEQFVDQQVSFGRDMVDDYMQESEELLQSAIDIIRDSGRQIEDRAEEAPHEVRQAVAS